MSDWLKDPKKAPEEVIYYIGNSKDGTVNAETLWNIYREQAKWHKETFPNIQILDTALHVDEAGAPHIHERLAWFATDKNGNMEPNQGKALEEMGIERPNPAEPKSRYNNSKITYTNMVREHFQSLCKAKGLEIISEPKEASKQGLSLEDAKVEMTRQELQELKNEYDYVLDMKKMEHSKLDKQIKDSTELLASLNAEITEAREKYGKYTAENLESLKTAFTGLTEANKDLEEKINKKTKDLQDLEGKCTSKGQEIQNLINKHKTLTKTENIDILESILYAFIDLNRYPEYNPIKLYIQDYLNTYEIDTDKLDKLTKELAKNPSKIKDSINTSYNNLEKFKEEIIEYISETRGFRGR